MIKVKKVKKRINGFTLGPMNFSIQPGTVTAIVGENSSGKSSLLKTIMNLIHVDDGIIQAFGEPISEGEDWKNKIGYQPQTTYGYDAFNGYDLKELIAYWYPKFDENLFLQMVEKLKIPLNKKYSKLSQGMQQKLVLALTIPRQTELLILDEPMTFMDIPAKNYITDLLVEWMEDEGKSIILASHQAEDIKKLADYLLIIRDGQQVEYVDKETLVERYRKYIFMGNMPLETLPGEIERHDNDLTTEDSKQTNEALEKMEITPLSESRLELEDIITLILEGK